MYVYGSVCFCCAHAVYVLFSNSNWRSIVRRLQNSFFQFRFGLQLKNMILSQWTLHIISILTLPSINADFSADACHFSFLIHDTSALCDASICVFIHRERSWSTRGVNWCMRVPQIKSRRCRPCRFRFHSTTISENKRIQKIVVSTEASSSNANIRHIHSSPVPESYQWPNHKIIRCF